MGRAATAVGETGGIMPEVKGSIVVESPPERVFEHLDDVQNASRDLRRVRFEHVDDGPFRGLGAKLKVIIDLAPRGVVRTLLDAEVSEHYYPERIAVRSEDGFMWEWTLGRVGDRTLVQLRHVYTLPGGPIGRLAGPALGPLVQREVDAALRDLAGRVVSAPV